ncbi:MAG: SdrD B-like domain-containing protein [Bacteroidota bacterium]
MGGLALSEDENVLWTINLADRRLYEMPLAGTRENPLPPATAGDISRWPATGDMTDLPGLPGGAADRDVNVRPFAVKCYRGQIYVGLVYTAESTVQLNGAGTLITNTGQRAQMQGFVYRFDPATDVFTQVLSFPLDYIRGQAIDFCTNNAQAEFFPWAPVYDKATMEAAVDGNSGFTENDPTTDADDLNPERAYPQAWLTDIDFDETGRMILGIRDRFADQHGFEKLPPTRATAAPDSIFSADGAGDVLVASPNTTDGGATYVLEFNSGNGTNGTAFGPTTGANQQEGPGNGEFFFDDRYRPANAGPDGPMISADCDDQNDFDPILDPTLEQGHDEISLGGLFQYNGTRSLIVSVYDPINDFDDFNQAGFLSLSTVDGSREASALVYTTLDFNDSTVDNLATFGKGNGLGDVEGIAPPAPLQIGNRLWVDGNNNGRQDANEDGLNGVLVELYKDINGTMTKVAETTTAADPVQGNGAFKFSDNTEQTWLNGETGVLPEMDYEIRVALADVQAIDSGLTAFTSTGADVSNDNKTDLNDSDASATGVIVFRTGLAGQHNQTLDIGVVEMAACALTVEMAVPSTCVPATNSYTLEVTISYSEAPLGEDIEISLDGGTPQSFTPASGTGTETFTLTGLTSDGTTDIDVAATFGTTTTCTDDLVDAYSAPESCTPVVTCDLAITAVTPTCAYNATTGQSTFSVQVDLSWDYADLTTTPEAIDVTLNGMTLSTAAQSAATGTASITFTNVPGPGNNLLAEAVFTTTSNCTSAALVDLIACSPACTDGLGGTVFNDFDNDGNGPDTDPGETGQENVLVEVYECDGMTPVYTTYTNADGNWTVPSSVDLEYPVRVEFSTPLEPWLQSSFAGPDNETNVQFVTAANCEVDYGVLFAEQNCQDNPLVVVPCYLTGPQNNNQLAIVGVYYNNPDSNTPTEFSLASDSQVGTVYGTAFQRSTQTLFLGAMVRHYFDYGPGGFDAIYPLRIDDPNGAAAPAPVGALEPVIDLSALGVNVGDDPRISPVSGSGPFNDGNVFQSVGKAGIGDIDLSDDGDTLFVVNLNAAAPSLVLIDVSDLNNVRLIREVPIPDPGCDAGDFAPWGLTYYRGAAYLGLVCTGETSQNQADLSATVYRFAGGNDFLPVVQFPLDYERSAATYRSDNTFSSADWRPWTNAWNPDVLPLGSGDLVSQPMPILQDIEFTDRGDMILGFGDRFSYQTAFGNRQPGQTSGPIFTPVAAGDVLKMCRINGSFVPEGSAGCPQPITDLGSTNIPSIPPIVEFFDDNYVNQFNTQAGHAETSLGGLTKVYGKEEVLVVSFDPRRDQGPVNTSGIRFIDESGANDKGWVIVPQNAPGANRKGGSLGDAVVLCEEKLRQIGNYAWIDENEDGIQQACEPPLPGVTVKLYTKPATGDPIQLASIETDDNGNYYFVGDGLDAATWTVSDTIAAGEQYFVAFCGDGTFDDTDNTIEVDGVAYCLTDANTGEGTNPDLNDSDATAQALGSLGTFPAYCTQPGETDTTNHTFDVGFKPVSRFDLALTKILDPTGPTGPFNPGDPVSFTIEVFNQGDVDAFAVEVSDYVPTGLTFVPSGDFPGATPETTIASIPVGQSVPLKINFTVDADAFAGNLINYAEITAADDDNDPDNTPPTDQDSTPGDNEGDDETGTDDDIDDEADGTPGDEDNPNDADDYDPASILVLIKLELCEDDGCSFIIDFETDENSNPLVAGAVDIFNDQPYANVFGNGDGLTFSTNNQSTNPLNLYDTDGTGGNDADLEFNGAGTNMWTAGNIITEMIGNVLIINADTDIADPNDFAGGGEIIVDSDLPLGRFAFEMVDLDLPVQGNVTFTNTALGTSETVNFADFEQGSGSPFAVLGVIFGDRTANRVVSATAEALGLPSFDRVVFDLPSQSGAIGVICATVNQKFDLALVKRLDTAATPGPFGPDSTVTFEIEVYNQGPEDAVDVVVKDYLPAGLSLAPASAPDWTVSMDTLILTDSIDLAAGDSTILSLTLQIASDFMLDTLVNRAEIAYFDDDGDPSTPPPADTDSTPDDNGDDPPEVDTPDEYADEYEQAPGDEDDPNDEDDYDWEGIPVTQNFDLALTKVVDTPAPITIGSTVTYTITVLNQGTLDATSVTVTDYLPVGLENLVLAPGQTGVTDNADGSFTLDAGADAGAMVSFAVQATVSASFPGGDIVNNAEITAAENELDEPDEDSTPGDNEMTPPETDSDNEIDDDGPGGNGNPDDPNDEDDYDPATITVEALSIGSTVFTDPDNDGLFEPGDGETGIDDVTVQLWDPGADGMLDGIDDVLLATDTTENGGNYFFGGLPPGDYLVVVPVIDNFGAGDPLVSDNLSSGPTDLADNGEDNDDNGSQTGGAGTRVVSPLINLAVGDEPEDTDATNPEMGSGADQDNAQDANGDMTVDFGFVPERIDVALRKTLVEASLGANGFADLGEELEFVVTVFNQGNIPLNAIDVIDYVPPGFAFAGTNTDFPTPVAVAGQVYDTTSFSFDFTAAPLAPMDSAKVSIFLVATGGATSGADYVNRAEVTSITDDQGDDRSNDDTDSTPDTDPTDDPGGAENTPSDDAIDGKGNGTPGDMDPNGDEDDADPAVPPVVDVALTKTLLQASLGPVDPLIANEDEVLEFEITVVNQGTTPVTDVEVYDNIPCGFDFEDGDGVTTGNQAIAANAAWIGDNASGVRQVIPGPLLPDSSVTVSIFLRVRGTAELVIGCSSTDNESFTNRAEVASLVDENGMTQEEDYDSNFDEDDPTEDGGGVPNGNTDNVVDGDGTADNGDDVPSTDDDDEDPANTEIVDVALAKFVDTTASGTGPYVIGDPVTFELLVINQGTVPLSNVDVIDSLPSGLVYNAASDGLGWTQGTAPREQTATTTISGPIAPGDTFSLGFVATIVVSADNPTAAYTNQAEVFEIDAALMAGTVTLQQDSDSPLNQDLTDNTGGEVNTPDDNETLGGGPGRLEDQDNADPALVDVALLSLGSTVFMDRNNNGQQDPGEPGVPNVPIILLDGMGNPIDIGADGMLNTGDDGGGDTYVTDGMGNYLFTNLLPDDYSVQIPATAFAPDGPLADFPLSSNATSSGFVEQDPDGTNPVDPSDDVDGDDNGLQAGPGQVTTTDPITLSANEEPTDTEMAQGGDQDDGPTDASGNMTLDLGFFAPVSLGDTAFVDLDGDGLQTPDEPGIGGVMVVLLDSTGDTVRVDAEGNTIPGVTTTAPDGSYVFDNLPPGEYSVVFDISTANNAEFYAFTTPNAGDDTDDSDNSIALSDSTAQSDPTPFLNAGENDPTLDVGVVCAIEVEVAEPFTVCSTQPIDLTAGASISPASLGGTWSTPDGTGTFTTGTDFATATTYVPSAADALRGSVTLVLTTNEPAGPCAAVSAQVTITILKVDCGQFFWDGSNG